MPDTFRPNNNFLVTKQFKGGQSGSLVPIIANYFSINFEAAKQSNIHKYRVQIDFWYKLTPKSGQSSGPSSGPSTGQSSGQSSGSSSAPSYDDDAYSDPEASDSSGSGSIPSADNPTMARVLQKNYYQVLDKFLSEDPRFANKPVARSIPFIYVIGEINSRTPPAKVVVELEGRMKEFYVKLYRADRRGLDPLKFMEYYLDTTGKTAFPQDFLDLNNAIFKTALFKSFVMDLGNNFYRPAARTEGHMMDFLDGIVANVRHCEAGLMLNLHLKTGLTHKLQTTVEQQFRQFVGPYEGKYHFILF